ncbi:PH domain-containing protein [Brachybacterium hainanense]|uniref:PH domain-containing protein n=1 Tax=Brachybacterium hainanense TaxID=1541174 RepID=A0ABV6RDQ6_9MICO
MSIPRRLEPESGPRRVLPDFRRSAATIERMLRSLDDGPALETRPVASAAPGSADAAGVRVISSSRAARTALLRAVVAGLLLWAGLTPAVLATALILRIPAGRSPRVELLLILTVLILGALALLAAGARWAVLALAAVRSRLERDAQAVTVFGPFGSRRVPWTEIVAVDSRVLHPVHGLTSALRLRGGGRVIMPLFDRPLWTYHRPSDRTIRDLRARAARHDPTGDR